MHWEPPRQVMGAHQLGKPKDRRSHRCSHALIVSRLRARPTRRRFQARPLFDALPTRQKLRASWRDPSEGPKSGYVLSLELQPSSAPRPGARVLSLIHISEPTRLGMISYAVF